MSEKVNINAPRQPVVIKDKNGVEWVRFGNEWHTKQEYDDLMKQPSLKKEDKVERVVVNTK